MLELSSKLLVNSFFLFTLIYIYGKLNNYKIIKFNFGNIFVIVISFILICYMSFESNKIIELIAKYIIITFTFKLLYNDDIPKTMVSTFLIYALFILGEILFSIFFILILGFDRSFFKNEIIGYLISNFIILLNTITIIKLNFINESLNNIMRLYVNKKILNTVIITTLGMISTCYLLYVNYLKIKPGMPFMVTCIFICGVVAFIIGYFKEKTRNNELEFKYDQLQSCIEPYGKLLNEKSKNQHEYRNQLILIRSMVKNRQAIKYIDEVLNKEKNMEEYDLISKFINIPNNNLNGLLHYKYSEMIKKNIKIYVDINENVSNNNLKRYLKTNLNDISKILGVYLDNAIEAASCGKNKYIIIEANCNENDFKFTISNTFSGYIAINKFDEEGYSIKGSRRGYGLSLVNDIINKHKEIKQFREVNGMYYVQGLDISYKK